MFNYFIFKLIILLIISSSKQLSAISLDASSPGYQLQTKIGFNNKIVTKSDLQTYLSDFQNQSNSIKKFIASKTSDSQNWNTKTMTEWNSISNSKQKWRI